MTVKITPSEKTFLEEAGYKKGDSGIWRRNLRTQKSTLVCVALHKRATGWVGSTEFHPVGDTPTECGMTRTGNLGKVLTELHFDAAEG